MNKLLSAASLLATVIFAPAIFGQKVGDSIVVTENYQTKIVDKITGNVTAGEIYRLNGIESIRGAEWYHVEGVRGWFPKRIALTLEAAEERYNKILASNPQDVNALVTRGVIRFELGRFDDALVDFDKARKLRPNSAVILNNFGRALRARGALRESIGMFSEAIRVDPKHVHAYHNRGLVYYALQDHPKAIADFKKAIELKSDEPWYHINLGHAQHANQEIEPALASYAAAEKLNPRIPELFIGRSHVYLEMNDLQRAMQAADLAVELGPKDAIAFNSRGWIHYKQKKPDLARADFDRAIELNPQFGPAYMNRGIVLTSQREFAAALQDFAKALELQPDSPLVFFNRGNAYFRSGQWQLALADYQKSLELAPELPEALAGIAWFHATCPEDSLRDGDLALKTARKLMEVSNDDPKSYHILAAALANQQQYDEAKATISEAIQRAAKDDPSAVPSYRDDLATIEQQQPIRAKAEK